VYVGFGGISSGLGFSFGGGAAGVSTLPPFFRFLGFTDLAGALPLAPETCCGSGAGSGGGCGNLASRGGGECDGREEGGDIDVISTDGERGRLVDEGELGDVTSSVGGGGGSTKWNILLAICIWDLNRKNLVRFVWKGGNRNMPFSQGCSGPTAGPHAIDPCAITTNYSENKAIFFRVIFDLCVQSGYAFQRTKVDVDGRKFSRGRGCTGIWAASPANGNR
jgi:hypothetical protein